MCVCMWMCVRVCVFAFHAVYSFETAFDVLLVKYIWLFAATRRVVCPFFDLNMCVHNVHVRNMYIILPKKDSDGDGE